MVLVFSFSFSILRILPSIFKMLITKLYLFTYEFGLLQGRSFFQNIHNSDFIVIRSKGKQETQSRGTFKFGSVIICLNFIVHQQLSVLLGSDFSKFIPEEKDKAKRCMKLAKSRVM